MEGITKALQRRRARLEKAQHECENQRQAVEQAKMLLQSKEEAVKAAESDLRFLQGAHTDLAKKYIAFTEAAEQHERQPKQTELQQSQLQGAQQAIWQAATH